MKAYQIISRMALMATASAFALAIAPVSFDGLSANVWHKDRKSTRLNSSHT